MKAMHRAAWVIAIGGLLAVGSTAFAPPVFRPPPPVFRPPPPVFRPPPPVFRPPPTMPGGATGIRPGSFSGITPGTFSGRIPSSIAISRPPTQIRAEVRGLITSRPTAAFKALNGFEARSVLDAKTRTALGLEAAERLAVKIETGRAIKSVAEVRSARGLLGDLPPEVRNRLEQVAKVAERRVLTEALEEVRAPAERGEWRQAAEKAEKSLDDLTQAGTGANQADARKALNEIRDVSRKLDNLQQFEETIKALEVARLGESVDGLKQIDRAGLPKELQRPAEGLQGLAEVRSLAATRWQEPPNIGRIREAVGRLDRGLIDVGKTEQRIGEKLLQEMAVKAHLEGHSEAYFKLMPEAGPPEHAARLLRDLKALALGESKVGTDVGKAALGEPGAAPALSPRAPPGVEPLIPEGSKASWRPPVKEAATGDLPPLQQATEAAAAMKAKAEANLKPQKATAEGQAQAARTNLTNLYQRVIAPEKEELRRFLALEVDVGRRLTVEERVRVRGWLGDNRTTAQIVKDLTGRGDKADDDAAFLADVEAKLGRVLTPAEKVLAKGLRRAGKTAAEAANALRSK